VALVDYFRIMPWVLGITTALVLANRYGLGYHLIKAGVRRDGQLARSALQAARVRRRWPRLSQNLKLALVDKTDLPAATGIGTAAKTATKPRVVVPRMRVRPDRYGVICDAKIVAGIGLEEWKKNARHLSDDWRAVRVAVSQPKPGRIRVRAVRVDPLAEPTSYDPEPAAVALPATLDRVFIGLDEYAEPVNLRLSGVSGICICGLAGYGKTSFLNNLITRLSPHPAVQFIGLDGKSTNPEHGDYGPVARRFAILRGDDIKAANELFKELNNFRQLRSDSIRRLLGVGNAWHIPFTPDWPLIILIIDECHTYFSQVKDGGNKEIKERNALAAQNELLVSDLIRKGRSVGIITIVATQKGTGDAIPTIIRDNCAVSLAFACRTIDAAIAALGEDIRQYPDVNPVTLRDPIYVGVAVMAVEGRPGFSRVRMPYVKETTAAAVAELHQGHVTARGELPIATLTAIEAD
jgi:DNA segregation ATPase FtsK/SpoIIIE, S-DNA-T family